MVAVQCYRLNTIQSDNAMVNEIDGHSREQLPYDDNTVIVTIESTKIEKEQQGDNKNSGKPFSTNTFIDSKPHMENIVF